MTLVYSGLPDKSQAVVIMRRIWQKRTPTWVWFQGNDNLGKRQ